MKKWTSMKKRSVIAGLMTAAASTSVWAADAETQAQIDELKAQVAALADSLEAQSASTSAYPVYVGGYGEMHLNLNQGKGVF